MLPHCVELVSVSRLKVYLKSLMLGGRLEGLCGGDTRVVFWEMRCAEDFLRLGTA